MAIGDSCVRFRGSTSTNGSQTSGITIGNILFFQARGEGSQVDKRKLIQCLDMSCQCILQWGIYRIPEDTKMKEVH